MSPLARFRLLCSVKVKIPEHLKSSVISHEELLKKIENTPLSLTETLLKNRQQNNV